jgi:hypothetical protein
MLDFAGSFASKQRCASPGHDTGKPSLQASRAEVAPNDPIYPPFKPLSWKLRPGCDDSRRIVRLHGSDRLASTRAKTPVFTKTDQHCRTLE